MQVYGAAAIMRVPGRIHMTWQDDNTLKLDTDAGTQTRLFRFVRRRRPGRSANLAGHLHRTLEGHAVTIGLLPGIRPEEAIVFGKGVLACVTALVSLVLASQAAAQGFIAVGGKTANGQGVVSLRTDADANDTYREEDNELQ